MALRGPSSCASAGGTSFRAARIDEPHAVDDPPVLEGLAPNAPGASACDSSRFRAGCPPTPRRTRTPSVPTLDRARAESLRAADRARLGAGYARETPGHAGEILGEDALHRREDVGPGGRERAQLERERHHPLPERYVGEDTIDERRRLVAHPARRAARAGATVLARVLPRKLES
jgi:hypothetical protein